MTADGTPATNFPKHTQEETDEGTALMKSFMEDWKSRVEANGEEMGEEEQVQELVKVAKEYAEKFEGNPWVKGLMELF